MLRRISTIIAAAAMVILSALPVSAATISSSTHAAAKSSTTHKISFPGLHGVSAWGTYTRSGSKVRVSVCAEDTVHGVFAAGAVTLALNGSQTKSSKFGAVDIGYHQTSCVSENLRYTTHLRVYTFVGGSNGKIVAQSKTKGIY
jgi:hypothetical protein